MFLSGLALVRARLRATMWPMWKRIVPFAYSEDIFSLSSDYLLSLGIKAVLSDLDNTLDPYKVKSPSPRVFELKERLDGIGIKLFIASNNHSDRVLNYAKELGVEAECMLFKPFARGLKKALKRLNLKPEEALMVGDQIVTDVMAGNGAKIRTILTMPLSDDEPWCTKLNRSLDRPLRKKLYRKGLLKEAKL